MSPDETYAAIKSTVLAYLPNARVLLFGSHARGDSNKHSDYDLLVITPNQLSRKERNDLTGTIDKSLVHAIHAPFDILLYSEGEIKEKSLLPGHIVRTAIQEGMAL